MADTDSSTKRQKLLTEQNQGNPSKFYSHFLYKALIVTVFLVILPLFPSQAPEFINQTVFNRSWELLRLLFVGIVVSYGLFSRRNDESEKENNHSKFDNAQSYVSRFLQVSSVFDEETENLSGSDENKVQTWSHQYYRNEPVLVVAKGHSVLDEQRGTSSRMGEKPLLLPVRSLKSRVSDQECVETNKESSGASGSLSRSSSISGSKRFSSNSNKTKNGELGDLGHVNLDEILNENVVLPSPIPWRSRSGRMEMKEPIDSPPFFTLPPSAEESEFNRLESRSFRPQMSRSSRSNSMSSSPKLSPSSSLSSPKKLSPSPSLSSSELQGKATEDLVRKKSYHVSSPPPPPPPPPPVIRKSSSVKLSSSSSNDGVSFEERSFTSEPNDLNKRGGEILMSRLNSGVEVKPRTRVDSLSMGKLVRSNRTGDSLTGGRKDKEIDDEIFGEAEKRLKEVEATMVKKMARKAVTFDQTSFKTERLSHECINMPKPSFKEFQEKQDFVEKVIVETDGDSESEDDDTGGSSFVLGIGENSNDEEHTSRSFNEGGPDVNKKADEFIAKFKEQIRLQRIDSIKKSSAQISRNISRKT